MRRALVAVALDDLDELILVDGPRDRVRGFLLAHTPDHFAK